jgi:RNA polymerase sigma factor (TIGR02999 family)
VSLSDPKQRLNELLPLVYDQLRAYASRALNDEPGGLTLQTTDLVHEVYLRLSQLREIRWDSDQEMMRTSVGIMRRVLVDHARARRSLKRTAPGQKMVIGTHLDDVSDSKDVAAGMSLDILQLDEALDKFASIDPRKAEVVQMRYFGGLSIDEVAKVMEISTATVKRDWLLAKAWLYRELYGEPPPQS